MNLAYGIDDKDVIERYLTEYPEETEQCIPTALRSILEVDYLPPVPFFPNQELLNYLLLLWSDKVIDDRLIDAAKDGLVYLVAYYLDRRADIHADNDYALRMAAYYGQTDTVELLLDRKANIHADNDYALIYAIVWNHTETIKLLESYIH